MAAILLAAAVTCLASLFVGQAALRLCGAKEWSWLAPSVGISVVMLIASPTKAIPGRTVTVAIFVAILVVAAFAWCLSSRFHRPPITGLTAAIPAALLCVIPFVAVGHGGILGVFLDNDMGAHLFFAQTFLSTAADSHHPALVGLYPLGPHAMVALIAKGFEMRADHAFTGWTLALPILNAWTALALVRRAGWLKQAVVATVVGLPFLVVAYYAEGSFKEVIQTTLVLSVLLLLAGYGPKLGRGRWVPFGLLVGGMVCVYSVTGLAWPVVFGGLWLVGLVVKRYATKGAAGMVTWVRGGVRAELLPLGLGLAALVLPLLLQAARIHRFIVASTGSNGIIVPRESLGNLAAPLPGWEGFGVWGNGDFRIPAAHTLAPDIWTGFVFALVLFGAWWLVRRGHWMLVVGAAASMAIWRITMDSQSPYTVAKALVIASPLLLILAVLPLVEQLPERFPRSPRGLFRKIPGQPLSWGLAAALVVLLVYAVGASDVRALRATPVGPTAHEEELRELAPLLQGKRTLFLGDDDFVKWEMTPQRVRSPLFNSHYEVPTREAKHWEYGQALDWDSVTAVTLNEFAYVVTIRDAAASQPPPQMHLVRQTTDYQLWQRVGEVQERSILNEGEFSGAILDCSTPEGRRIVAAGGKAAIRPMPVTAEGPVLNPGTTGTVALQLGPGRWRLGANYGSRLPIQVNGPGIDTTLSANLDRPGARLPVGTVQVTDGSAPTELTFHLPKHLLAPDLPLADVALVVASKQTPERVVPIAQACGRYVDWYRSAASTR